MNKKSLGNILKFEHLLGASVDFLRRHSRDNIVCMADEVRSHINTKFHHKWPRRYTEGKRLIYLLKIQIYKKSKFT